MVVRCRRVAPNAVLDHVVVCRERQSEESERPRLGAAWPNSGDARKSKVR